MRPSVLAPALAFALAAGPLAAAVPARPVPARPADPAAAVALARDRAAAGDCAGALRMLDPLAVGEARDGDRVRVAAQLVRLPCLAARGRVAEVSGVVAELRRTAPDQPAVRAFAVLDDAQAGRAAQAADGLAALADAGSPALRLIPGALWRGIAQGLLQAHDTARRDRLALALARAQWVPADDPDLAEPIAAEGAGAALDAHDLDTATALLARVTHPEMLADIATERRYAALWPAIERRLGPASGTAVDRSARDALDRFADAPDDVRARRDAVRAFVELGRAPDVIATAAPVAVAEGMGEDRVLIVLAHAQALSAGGDRAGAEALLRPFVALDPARTPQAATALISLAEAYHEHGRYADELALARDSLARAGGALSPYGMAWLRRNELCALAGLGRDAEARAAGDAIKAIVADNQPAAIEGLLCAKRDAEAGQLAVAALATADGADRLADQFQPSGALFMAAPSVLRDSWQRLLKRGEVRRAFDARLRILPQPLWPKRDRPLPAPPAGAGPGGLTTT